MKDNSRSQAVTYTVKVVTARKRSEIATLLLQTSKTVVTCAIYCMQFVACNLLHAII